MTTAQDDSQPRQTGDPITRNIRRVLMVLLVIVAIIVVGLFLDGRINHRGPLAQLPPPPSQTPSPQTTSTTTQRVTTEKTQASPAIIATTPPSQGSITPVPSATLTLTASLASERTVSETIQSTSLALDQGALFVSLDEGGHKHLFAYHPQALPFTRLTAGAWDDITPSASPDGNRLAFASNRDGKWDLYILDLVTGKTSRFTNTPEYDASPSWSPDGLWLVYETYTTTLMTRAAPTQGNNLPANPLTPTPPVTATISNLEILIRPADGSQAALRLTNDPGADFDPTWSPAGRQIAFVSNRTGENDIWLADLDRIDNRFLDLSHNPKADDTNPAWSPDGGKLTWTTDLDGYQNIDLLDLAHPNDLPRPLGAGEDSVWSRDGNMILTFLPTPNRNYLSAYWVQSPGLALPPVPLSGETAGMTWGSVQPTRPLPFALAQAEDITPTPLWQAVLTPVSDLPSGRQHVVALEDVQAPYAMLNDQVDDSFNALRAELAIRLGWDLFSSLENAYVPLTSPLFPGLLNDWLYTGRAIALNTSPINAGWMLAMREDFGPYTYWRLFLRTRFQDGSQGMPLSESPWDLKARYGGDPRAYEQGGAPAPALPPGYWLDFTELAASYGWERLPALTIWRSALPAARYNEFVHTDGLDWFTAMVEIYPIEAVYTPTPVQPPTLTPTPTRRPTRTPTPTRTPWPTRTPTITPTPLPSRTPTITPAHTITPVPKVISPTP